MHARCTCAWAEWLWAPLPPRQFQRSETQLVGVACLLLAVKYQDNTRTPGMHRLQHWTWITDDAYTPQQLREMELFVPTSPT
jgi:hypothetical protein